MTLPTPPPLGSNDLVEHRAFLVCHNADLWLEDPSELNTGKLREATRAWLDAQEAWRQAMREAV